VQNIEDVYDNTIKKLIAEDDYLNAYLYVYQQKNEVKDLDKELFFYLILWQIILECYLGIEDEAKEHFLFLYKEIKINSSNIELFIKTVLFTDTIETSLETEGLFETLYNVEKDSEWIKFYLMIISYRNKRRIPEVFEELLNMKEQINDKWLLAKVHLLLAEIYREKGEDKWLKELKIAEDLNSRDLYLLKLKLKFGLINKMEIKDKKLYRYFPENSSLINEIYNLKTKDKKIKDFKFFCVGGGNIGASSYLISYKGVNILLDAGILIKEGETYYNNYSELPFDLKDIDLLIISHAHLDHCGGIIKLLNEGICCPIIMSQETADILRAIFFRTKKDYEFNLDYSDMNLKERFEDLLDTGIHNKYFIKNKKVEVDLKSSGHIIGAVAVSINIDSLTIFYTGDFTLKDMESNKGLNLTNDFTADILITEATYGYNSNFTVNNKFIHDKLFLMMVEKLIHKNGILLLPVYSIGKGQDLLLLIKKVFRNYISFNIFVDGDIAFFTKIYEKYFGKIYSNGILDVSDNFTYESKKEFIRKEVSHGKCMIVASSSNLKEGSTSFIYAKEMLDIANSSILHLNLSSKEFLGLKNQYLGLVNHGKLLDLLEVVLKTNPSKVFIVHRGHINDNSTNIKKILSEIRGLEIFEPADGETVYIN